MQPEHGLTPAWLLGLTLVSSSASREMLAE
jgi:hypothetical protein